MARRLPSLNALRAFEAFSRHGRMTLAAAELGLTHGAVSRHVRSLERQLGARLTVGPRNQLTLTEAGLRLAQAATQALDLMEAALPVEAAGRDPRTLQVSCQPTFAMKWMIPRLPGFLAANPDTPVRIVESNGPFDFAADRVDIAVRMRATGDMSSPDALVTPFMDHFIGPVVAPELARSGLNRLADLLAAPRLHTRTFPSAWADWADQAGLALPQANVNRDFDHYFYMLEAAAAGLGVAIGPWSFVQRDLAAGRLAAPLGLIPAPARIAALTPKSGMRPSARRFLEWLLEEGRAAPFPPNLQ
jgi:LysR family glycine cleavage system transcriptional activator